MRCEPANTLIRVLGGLTKVARIIDATPNGVMRWRMPKSKGGTGGAVPHWHVEKLMADAASRGISLTHSDFFKTVDFPAPEHAHTPADDAEHGAPAASCPVKASSPALPAGASR